jgi:hypothetical protein
MRRRERASQHQVSRVLRQFLYSDDALIDEFLAQLEGGQSEAEHQVDRRDRGGAGEAGIGAGPLRLGGSAGRSSGTETERVVRQVRASKFDRLYQLVTAGRSTSLNEIDQMDQAAWNCFGRGDLVSVAVNVAIPSASRVLNQVPNLEGLLPLVRAFEPDAVDNEAEEAIRGITALAATSSDTVTIVGAATGSPGYRLIAQLRRDWTAVPIDDLEGEATLVGKVVRKLSDSDRELVVDIPGMSVLNRKQRRELAAQEPDGDEAEMYVSAPAAVITPLALFR